MICLSCSFSLLAFNSSLAAVVIESSFFLSASVADWIALSNWVELEIWLGGLTEEY
jgi:hypothetical protein